MDKRHNFITNGTNSMFKISNVDCVPLVPCNLKVDEPLEEDRRLKNWHHWLLDHQRHQERLVRNLKREPLELALNAHERSRTKNETRYLIEAASRSEVTNQDKYRGNPIFWQQTESLSRTNCELGEVNEKDDQEIFMTMNRNRKNLPPEITRVALPSFIRKEKMLLESYVDTQKVHFNSKWERGNYLRQRTADLKKEIKALEPKKPETEDLMVIGKNFQTYNKEKFIRLPVITITSHEDKKRLLNYPDERIALKIQNRHFVFESGYFFEKLSREETEKLQQSKEDLNCKKYAYSVFETNRVYKILSKKIKPIIWSLNFQTNGNELCEKKFILENKGIQTLTIDWRNVAPKSEIAIPDRIKSFFFFNKNPISILPGQKFEVSIWFHSERPAVATETWNLLIEPKIFPGTLSFRLWGTANGSSWKLEEAQKMDSVKEKLRRGIRNSIIRDIIEDVFRAATREPIQAEVPYSKFFLEADIFHARNPAHFYNSILVVELKCIYKKITNQENWSLLLKELRTILLRIEDNKMRREMLLRFNEICMQCLRPSSIYEPPVCSRQKLVYWLLCTFFNKFEDESNFVLSNCCYQIVSDDLGEVESDSEAGESEAESSVINMDFSLYYEVFFIRLYYLLGQTIDRVCAAVDSQIYLN